MRISILPTLLFLHPAAHAQVPVQNPANGHWYDAVGVVTTWTQARDLAAGATFNGMQGHLATVSDAAENDFLDAALVAVTDRYWLGGFQDLNAPSYAEPDGGWTWVTAEPWGFTSWKAGEPNDFGGTEHFLAFDNGPAEWNDAPDDWAFAAGYIVEYESTAVAFCFGDGTGASCPCGNDGDAGEGCANSTGAGGLLVGAGSASVTLDDLSFAASNLLAFQPALLFSGENAINAGNGIPFGDGLRCAGMNVVRLGVVTPDGGGAAWGPGLAAAGGWASGDTRYFQTWYRDPSGSPCGAGFNLTNALELNFVP